MFNCVYVLGYPLAALAMLAAGRRLGLGWPAAAVAGILFAFVPYHALRNQQHLFLGTYFPIPFMVTVLVELTQGQLPFFPADALGRRRFRLADWGTIRAVLIAGMFGMANPYYGYFALLLLVVIALANLLARRRWPGLLSAGFVAGLLGASMAVNTLPSLIYQFHHGRNVLGHARMRKEAEYYALKFTHLVLPAPHHLSDSGKAVERFYHAELRPLENENRSAALGSIGAVGFVALLLTLLAPRPIGSARQTALARLNLAAFLIGTAGGVGVLVNLAFSQFRCYSRICMFIACFALLAVAGWLDAGLGRLRRWSHFSAALAASAALVAFGIWDGPRGGFARIRPPQLRNGRLTPRSCRPWKSGCRRKA